MCFIAKEFSPSWTIHLSQKSGRSLYANTTAASDNWAPRHGAHFEYTSETVCHRHPSGLRSEAEHSVLAGTIRYGTWRCLRSGTSLSSSQ